MANELDLYSEELDTELKTGKGHQDDADLYNDVLAPTHKVTVKTEDLHDYTNYSQISAKSSQPGWVKRVSVYVGNLTWWTTDQNLTDAIHEAGVLDLLDIKFHENRVNGQSKGFCVVHLGSDNSAQILIDKLPKIELHSQKPLVTPCNKQHLSQFEKQARPSHTETTRSSSTRSSSQTSTFGSSNSNSSNMPQFPTPNIIPPGIPPMPGVLPPMPPGMPPMIPPPFDPKSMSAGMMPPIPPFMAAMSGGPMPHINPAAFLGAQMGGDSRRSNSPPISDAEFEEVMNRNRQVSSTAITRARLDASRGEYEDSKRTLKLAIKLIKQSKVSDDHRCKSLIGQLDDCLREISNESYREGGHRDRRKRSHSGDRSDRRFDRYRSRSRERYDRDRSRERYRDRSRSREHDRRDYRR